MTLPSGSTPTGKPGRGRDADAAADEAEMRIGWRMAGLAFVMSSEAAAGAIIGLVIDYFAGTGSRWLLIGGIVGIAVGLLSFTRGALSLNRLVSQQEQSRRARGIPPPPPLKDEELEDSLDSQDDER